MESKCSEMIKKLEEVQELLNKLDEGLYFQVAKVQTSIAESKKHLLHLHYLLRVKEMMKQDKYVLSKLTYEDCQVVRIDDVNQIVIIKLKRTSGYIEVTYEEFFKTYINPSKAF